MMQTEKVEPEYLAFVPRSYFLSLLHPPTRPYVTRLKCECLLSHPLTVKLTHSHQDHLEGMAAQATYLSFFNHSVFPSRTERKHGCFNKIFS